MGDDIAATLPSLKSGVHGTIVRIIIKVIKGGIHQMVTPLRRFGSKRCIMYFEYHTVKTMAFSKSVLSAQKHSRTNIRTRIVKTLCVRRILRGVDHVARTQGLTQGEMSCYLGGVLP
jgi:hypothetical protein